MKKWIISVLLMAGAGANAATYTRNASTGDWSDLSKWDDNSSGSFVASTVLPGSSDDTFVNNNVTVDLDADALVSTLVVVNQNDKNGTLNLNHAGATLGATNSITVGYPALSGVGTLNVSAGTLTQPPELTVNAGSSLNINGGTFSGSDTVATELLGGGSVNMTSGLFAYTNSVVYQIDNALFEIRGGIVFIDSQVRVGHSSGGSELRVVGDDATINFTTLNQNSNYSADGIFRFVLDETGVSTINCADWVHLGPADLIVDGSAYTGGPTTILLFDSPNLASISTNVVITGFDPSLFNVSVVQSQDAGEDWVQLVIEDAIPPVAPTLDIDVSSVGSGVVVSWVSETSRSYALEARDDLVSGTWQNIATNLTGNGGTLAVTNEFSSSIRFYRAYIEE